MIPYGRQDITQEDIDAVAQVLRSDFLTQGPLVPLFEMTVAQHARVHYAVAMNSATSALHLACLALGLGPGDWLWTSPITFVASANCARHCGANVDFVDIDAVTYNLSPAALQSKLRKAEIEGRLPKVVIPVHLAGQPCDMKAIHSLARRYGFRIVEDASHAIGASYDGAPVGNCRYSDVTVFSFHPVKIITTTEGGIAVTNDSRLAEAMALLRSHGITRDSARMTQQPHGPWYYEQIDLGFNYRMTDVQAALGVSQMKRLFRYVDKRRELAERYTQLLATLPLQTPSHHGGMSSVHLYIVRVQRERRRQLFDALRSSGIGVNLHYIPVHLQPYYRQVGFREGDFPEAERYYAEAITLPLYPAMTDAQQDQIATAVGEVLLA
jgi:UDP-4-amino-4,6-dideoxy-N-acetyl-beta-L-altrosamine transaminase